MSVETKKRKSEGLNNIESLENPIDEVVQLYISHVIKDFKNNEPRFLNGVINYCNDYMIKRDNENIKKQKNSETKSSNSTEYKYFGSLCAIYALALSKLSYFINKTDENEEDEGDVDYEGIFNNILDVYNSSFEFIELGLKNTKNENDLNYKILKFVESFISLQKIANYFIGKEMVSYYEFDEHIKNEIAPQKIAELFATNWSAAKDSLKEIISIAKSNESYEKCINEFIAIIVPDLLQTLNVIFDSNETLGSESKEKLLDEGIDEDFEFQIVKDLPKRHPLSQLHSQIIGNYPQHVTELREMLISGNELLDEFAESLSEKSELNGDEDEEDEKGIENLSMKTLLPFRLETLRTIGDYYLKELDNKNTDDKKMESLLKQNSIFMSKLYQLSEFPDDWVIYSESLIQLSALNESNKKISDKLLKKALKLLQKANRVSNGKYDDFIESLEEDLD
ncbi:hypothetical protein QEN19_002233 [Hanseniaspora menglaensis]